MDEKIRKLDEKTDAATKVMLQKVIDKKQKFETLKRNHLIVLSFTLAIASFSFLFLYKSIIVPYSYSFAVMFSMFVTQTIHLYILILLVGCYGLMQILQEKRDKKEAEFHTLRCEIIDKSSDLWSDNEGWRDRHHVFEMMKQEYDINLYYESK